MHPKGHLRDPSSTFLSSGAVCLYARVRPESVGAGCTHCDAFAVRAFVLLDSLSRDRIYRLHGALSAFEGVECTHCDAFVIRAFISA